MIRTAMFAEIPALKLLRFSSPYVALKPRFTFGDSDDHSDSGDSSESAIVCAHLRLNFFCRSRTSQLNQLQL